MIFRQLAISGVFLLDPESPKDRRGFFTRGYCRARLEERGLDPAIVRTTVAIEHQRGTVRGLCYRDLAEGEARLLRCTRGAIQNVVLDLRPESPTFKQHLTCELAVEGRQSLYLPAGLAHGFQTLEEETEVFCQFSELENGELVRGVRWNDPAFDIVWPLPVSEISPGDREYPDFAG